MFASDFTIGRMLKASAIALGLFTGAAATQALTGSDMFVAQAHAEIQRTMKLALNKSAVVRLPAGVKDIIVGNPDVADVVLRSKRTMYVFARKLGETNIFLIDARGKPIAKLDLSVVINPSSLQKLLKKAIPGADIRVEPMENQILLAGTVKTPADVNKAMQIAQNYTKTISSQMVATSGGNGGEGGMQVVNAIRVTGKDQVMIKVKLAEVQRDVFKQLRTNFSSINFTSGNLGGAFGLLFPFSLGNNIGSYGGQLSYAGRNVQSNTVLEALERDGLMRLLAEPTLTAISGEAAKFVAGGEVPLISDCTRDSDTRLVTCTYEYKPVGVMLGFTPLVLSESRISLKLNVEVSEISNKYAQVVDGGTLVGIEKRQTATTVELPSGGTLAIGGMIREQTKQNIDGVPGLKNLPILGALFRSRAFQANQS